MGNRGTKLTLFDGFMGHAQVVRCSMEIACSIRYPLLFFGKLSYSALWHELIYFSIFLYSIVGGFMRVFYGKRTEKSAYPVIDQVVKALKRIA